MALWAEEFGDLYQTRRYLRDGFAHPSQALPDRSKRWWRLQKTRDALNFVAAKISGLFLPIGFPNSVRPEYLEYQFWDTLQALSSYLRGIFTTRALLVSAGVGNEDASALSAALTWVFRDGVGMVGGLALGFAFGGDFDARLKEWRLFADLANDVGLTLDLLAPSFQGPYLLVCLSIATLCKAACGVAAGSTKASITAHMSLEGNTADVAAKEGAQETCVTLLGLGAGVALAKRLDSLGEGAIFKGFAALTALHAYANWKGVAALRLRTLNRHRLSIIRANIQRREEAASLPRGDDASNTCSVAPEFVAAQEARLSSWLALPGRVLGETKVVMGARLDDLFFAGAYTRGDLDRVLEFLDRPPSSRPSREEAAASSASSASEAAGQPLDRRHGRGYLLACAPRRLWHKRKSSSEALGGRCFEGPAGAVRVLLKVGATPLDQVRGLTHALALVECLEKCSPEDAPAALADAASADDWLDYWVTASASVADAEWPALRQALMPQGDSWDLSRVHLGAAEWRTRFAKEEERPLNTGYRGAPKNKDI
eukprot:CAMPEP_0172602614 /NCGR_PEP_ID=MMETSP1068-20121228/22789_1 /TAXON_ID=35684 /ORGANISM="Pseudopedinella elastica, Strain CCMP716" /LENGTH=541 /DNA_ID=CAMNT_0013404031 /DNA_START=49 /DNA_END=1674 /DNA_ORIENTATION=+